MIINFFGGPGVGKSMVAADVYAKLKWLGISVELVTEYAKDKVWEKSLDVLNNQLYIFGKQYHKLQRVARSVTNVVTDSPILNSILYGENESSLFRELVLEKHNKFNNFNILLGRTSPYCTEGRVQDAEGAKELDDSIHKLLLDVGVPFIPIPTERESVPIIVDMIINRRSTKDPIKEQLKRSS